jgi:hypothetical protein
VIVPAGEGTVHVDAVIGHVRGRVADFRVPQSSPCAASRCRAIPAALKGQLREETDWGDPLR